MDNAQLERLKKLQDLSLGDTEQEVREVFITPLLQELGYESGTKYHIDYEFPSKARLENKTESIKIDYVLSVGNEMKWILEAKRTKESVWNEKYINQAHRYATIKTINVDFYALCNGEEFALFLSKDRPNIPIFHFKRNELIERWDEINAKLSGKSFDTSIDNTSSEIDGEIISPIIYAENFEIDKLPCNPRDFVGREGIITKFWDFIDKVKSNKTFVRFVGFEGDYDIGKSSLILKLQDESKKNHSDSIFFYAVDVTVTQTQLFAAIVIKTAIKKAIEENFIELPEDIFDAIDIKENGLFFEQLPMQKILQNLKDSKKILIIFFDNFGDLLKQTKFEKSYELVYKTFEIFINKITAEKYNIVLGFSWNTGVESYLNEQIAHKWATLKKKREVFQINEFSHKEAEKYINLFTSNLKNQKRKITKKELEELEKFEEWLLQKCYASPWLLRKMFVKFCQADSQFRVPYLKYQHINKLITDMFIDDFKSLSLTQIECLQKIATFADNDTLAGDEKDIKILIEKGFVKRSGFNYDVKTPILREFILDHQVQFPDFSMIYIPKCRISVSLKAFRMLKTVRSKEDLIKKLTDSDEGTIENIIRDLRYLFQIEYDVENDNFIVLEDVLKMDDHEIANYLQAHLKEHLIVKKLNNHPEFKPEYRFYRKKFENLLKEIYFEKSITEKTLSDYTSRILSWLYFAGLIERHDIKPKAVLVIPFNRPGKQQGKLSESELQLSLF
ncbi:type I restriction enzyme HsdR N-terminal domain-containing protein [Sphaerospermopsis torques-reginae]|uniref:Type I restriction enzyme HsdR N-terminal domain-containing protein n=1 Tax=Sphaerospermopsis torques-reginae ITEP-024 TaxID=984208 RepID=A0ABX8WVA7_9CYAN|nr:type I restriction enzyme HsdR N-terminal domain-containing protein [Sphaerospermopsis torques-reginae]QYX30359.1 type I restriction enzyme HsdR N-terminal domain-containing protein [Sphaerospermopsis torques-reginae ITEP-024]